MEIRITKEEFEQSMPVGVSAGTELFEKLEPQIAEEQAVAFDTILGEVGLSEVANDVRGLLRKAYVKYICVSAFLAVLRQLDLVLTPSGFGVISSNNYAPASSARVDKLEEELRTRHLQARSRLITMLRSEEWGETPQAVECVPYVYTAYQYLTLEGYAAQTYKDWNEMQKSIELADNILRKRISDEQMDAILKAFRRCEFEYVQIMIGHIRRFTTLLHERGEREATRLEMGNIYNILEKYPQYFLDWQISKQRAAYYSKPYENTKDSPAYIFG